MEAGSHGKYFLPGVLCAMQGHSSCWVENGTQEPDQRPRNQPEAEMMVAWTRSVAMGKERSGQAWERLRKQNQDDLVVDCL